MASAAAEIENALARLRIEERNRSAAIVPNKRVSRLRKEPRPLFLVHDRQRRRRTGNTTFHRFVDADIVGLEDLTCRPIQRNSRAIVRAERSDLNGLGLRQIALRLNHEEDGRGAESVLLLLGIERLLLQNARFLRRLVPRARDCCSPISAFCTSTRI